MSSSSEAEIDSTELSPFILAIILITFFHSVLSRHRIRHHKDRFKRQQGEHLYLPGSYVTEGGEGEDAGPWGDWTTPSPCSRTCGGGVSSQQRTCQDGYDCRGPTKRHFSCNTQDCPDNSDYRAQQCSEFNNIPFEGIYYEWIPYTKAPNPCELNCMPRGDKFYYNHGKAVIDGTRCNDEKNDVCVNGTCQPVGCDMMLGSNIVEDECRVCGGDGSSCNTFESAVPMKDMQAGYNDILLIPAGATNIRVEETEPSNNYLAVRNTSGHYYLNGYYRIDFPRTMEFSGSKFKYERYPQEFTAPDVISALGPTDEPLFIVLLYQDSDVPVSYKYSLPKDIQLPSTETYAWTFDEFTECSASCGGGYQFRNVTCAERRSLIPADRALCDSSNEPETQTRCNTVPCPAQWIALPWKECSKPCGDEGGVQRRDVTCQRVGGDGVPAEAKEQECEKEGGSKPDEEKKCNVGKVCSKWHVGPWKPCDHLCGDGKQTRKVRCYIEKDHKIITLEDSECEAIEPRPETEKKCNIRPCEGVDWITSEWSGCERICGLKSETRKVHCATANGKIYPDDLCEPEQMPESVRECESTNTTCEYLWYASQWSECSVQCGPGVQTRTLFCGVVTEEGVKKVEDDNCDPSKHHETLRNCTGEQEECDGEWFSGPWGKCSKSCGGGERTKKVVCIKDLEVVDPSACGSDKIVFSQEDCNTQPCSEDTIMPTDVTQSVDESEPETSKESTKEDVTTAVSELTKESDSTASEDTDWTKESKITEIFEITTAHPKDTKESVEEEEDDTEYEIVFASNCDDGEWVDSPRRMIEIKQKDEPIDTTSTQLEGLTTETTFSLDDMMLSDGTTAIEGESTFDFTSDTGSGDDELTTSADKTGSTVSDIISTDEGSGTEPTIISDTAVTDGISITTSESSSESLGSSSSDLTTETSSLEDVTTDSSALSSTIYSATSSDSNTDSSVGTTINVDTSDTTVSSGSSESSSLSSSSSTDTSDSTTESATTETSISTDSDGTTESTSFSSSSSSTYVTETTEYTDSTVTETTDVSSTIDTSSTIIETSSVSTDISSVSSESTTDLTDTTGSETTTEISLSTDISSSTDVSGSTTELSSSISTDSSSDISHSTTEFTTSSTEGIDSSTIFTQSTDTSGSTTDVTGSTETTTEFTSSTESTTEFTAITESTTEFTGSTESTGISSSTSEFDGSTTELTGTTSSQESTTEFTLSTISGETTETDIFSSTTTSGETEETTIDLYGTTHIREIFAQRGLRMCKRRKIMTCKKTKWGCCWDNINAAKGPFDKGCPAPKTCKEAKYGCCPDGVSAALGPKGAGCPASQCAETLFGCCWDNKTTSEGNDGEGCPPKCLNTKWGCCDDNSTEAQGPNHKGCPEEVFETTTQLEEGTTEPFTEVTTEVTSTTDCNESTYRCCPDGKTPAEGPGFQGCGLPCSDSLNGCCGDGVTPAHGPSGEGCCLKSQFGCCPDSIVPARGLNGEGCDCQYSPYGCCPDNKTSAQGYNNEGCNCKFNEFGCCPDLATPANGPDFEGCLCHTFQFGCCPDGVTIAKGPHQQGCGCRNMEFGCCSDQETPAKGPDMFGCGCETTEYGCCLDGTSEAKGEDFEGCEEIPPNKQAGCTVPKENGSCNNYTVKWFFDMAYGGCSRFWYGGCGGNENRYKSKEECDQICVQPQGKERCNLPKIPGPCEGYYPQWYYDAQLKQCAQFIYGGCLGNNNRFETREECQDLCESRSSLDACEQKVEQGPCRGSYLRYYFDKESGQCTEFQYGGCKGNQNNFLTKEACLQKCTSPGQKKEYCTLHKEKGNCTDILPNWYYDSAKRRCSPFYYSGCNGNQNNFEAKGACEEDCPTEIAKDTCQLAAEVGECANYVDRWYYDTREKSCRQFYYGGCGGNGNNFETQQRCQQRCEQNDREVAPEPEPTEPAQVEPFTTDMCFLPSETGSCRASFEKYFYDRTDGVCKKFIYGGCQGNRNNFDTIELCLQYCGAAQDLCTLPSVVGPCNGQYLQYYYDAPTDSCLPFNFGGCGGNYNRFQDQLSCEQRCKETPSQTIATQAPPVPSEIAMCYQPSDQGNCTERYVAFYYDQNARACAPFTYTGCGGNDNRFNSEEQCERQCGNFRGQDVCNMERDPGPCRGYFVKYYYDKIVGRCEQFAYGGCQGNGNRFSSNEECEHICLTHDETKPNVTSTAACLLPVDQGSCEGGYHKRWYFDDRRGECIAFIYSGCGGNFNNFKTFQSCLNYCKELLPGTEPPVPAPVTDIAPHPCQEVFDECASLRCPYGVEPFVDENECNRCKCRDPCSQVECPEDEQCAIDINRNRTDQDDADFVAICRKRIKPGTCPNLEQSDENCERECISDADCALDLKCCSTGCGSACVDPAVPAELVTQRPEPVFTEGPIEAVYQPPKVDPLSYEPQITALYGDQAVLNCAVTGNPNPKIRWRKGSLEIDGTQERYRIKLDQSLQIITLHKTDSGIYLCTADNGLGEPITNEITLNVVDSSPRPATVLDPQTSGLPAPALVTLNAPAAVDCFALGNPFPAVTWWKDDSLIPFRNAEFEMRPDYSLLIHSVKLHNLGVYTCQAYNGVGKAASWSVAVRAMGPYSFSNRIEEKLYGPFIVDPNAPDTTTVTITTTTTARPSPVRLPPRRPTPQPYIPVTDEYTEPPNEIWPEPPIATASIIVVPVRANITSSDQRYPVGSDIEIPCAIQGFPSPQVKWYKDGVEVQNTDRIHISDSHKLTITEATKGDSGDYQCEATNAFSRASSTLSISIEGMYIHPSCTDNRFFANCALIVRAKICSHKYYARFCCRSCTEAGLLPVDGSHLRTLDRQNELDSNLA